jgi:hypothetical protein
MSSSSSTEMLDVSAYFDVPIRKIKEVSDIKKEEIVIAGQTRIVHRQYTR